MPAVTVIIPTRRSPALLKRAIDSLLTQIFADFEIVVVDHNPPEGRVAGTPAHRSWLRDRRVRLLEGTGATNPAGLRNAGLAMATGDWVTFLDDDDEYRPTKIERQWVEAERSRIMIGLCQMRFHLPLRSRVRGSAAREVAGDELLLSFPGMLAVFHARAPGVRFEESLDAGEDMHYFQRLVRHFNMSRVFNVPEPLVDVHVQADAHLNLNAEGVWKAVEKTLGDFGAAYTSTAQRVFRLRAQLGYCKHQRGRFGEMLVTSARLLHERKLSEARLILNSFLFKSRRARRWLVS